MVDVRPFRALRPASGRAQALISPPYDVIDVEEARFRIIHIEFIEKVSVSDKSMFLDIMKIFRSVQIVLNDSIYILTKNLQIYPNEGNMNLNYYQRLLHFLNFFPRFHSRCYDQFSRNNNFV